MSEPMDCQNNPCWFAVETGGMRTQGGCRCMDHLVPELSPARQREVRDVIRATIAAHVNRTLELIDLWIEQVPVIGTALHKYAPQDGYWSALRRAVDEGETAEDLRRKYGVPRV